MKTHLSILIRGIDNPRGICHTISNIFIDYPNYIDKMEIINNLNYKELINLIDKLDFSFNSFVLMLPKNE